VSLFTGFKLRCWLKLRTGRNRSHKKGIKLNTNKQDVDRDQKIQELIYWVNQQSTDGRIDDIYISHVERLCEELGIDFDKAYELYDGEDTTWTE
jgi:hypothetical protein